MGNALTTPRSIAECIDKSGRLNPQRVMQFCSARDAEDDAQVLLVMQLAAQVEAEQSERDDHSRPKRQRTRSVGALPVMSQTGGGQIVQVGPRQSSWCLLYVNIGESARTRSFEKTFRQRFQMPYSSFLDIVDMAKLSRQAFFSKLVEHFYISLTRNLIRWPTRNGYDVRGPQFGF